MKITFLAAALCACMLNAAANLVLNLEAVAAEPNSLTPVSNFSDSDQIPGISDYKVSHDCAGGNPSGSQKAAYDAQKSKSVIELQQFRNELTAPVQRKDGVKGTARLINLNPSINSWFLLKLEWESEKQARFFHLENRSSSKQRVLLDPDYPFGVVIESPDETITCDIWSGGNASELYRASSSGSPHASLCGGRLFLRNPTKGQKTTEEWVAEVLRDRVWGGESIISAVKSGMMQDAFLSTSELESARMRLDLNRLIETKNAPPDADINPLYLQSLLSPAEMRIGLETETPGKMLVGRWYKTRHQPGVFVSVIEPALISDELKKSIAKKVLPLDELESKALVYLISFDLRNFDAKFALGTDHPTVEWSTRVQAQVLNPKLPGPDGINDLGPLVRTGIVSPVDVPGTVATFTGGFKRLHGAFRFTELALKNHGTHYGFIEDGVVLSKLQPQLATFLALADGTVQLKTWQEADNSGLQCIRYARQNGVPLIDYDPASGVSAPGEYVRQIRVGNWSGTQDNNRRTVRAGLCLQEKGSERFLTYAYFSSATPSAMAQVFQAYHCRYAMHLDMNALEHTYLALYHSESGKPGVEHLVNGMEVLDKTKGKVLIPRFLGMADNRDFFYITRKAKL